MDDLALNLFKILGTGIAHAQNATSTTGGFTPISEGFNQVIGFVGPAAQISGGDFGQVVNGIYRLSIRIAGAVAVAMFVYGGIMYMTQPFGVSEGGVGKAKEKMQNAILGLLMLLATWVIFNQINPDILSLKVNAKPLEALKSATPTQQAPTETIPTRINNSGEIEGAGTVTSGCDGAC